MELNLIYTRTTWNDAVGSINSNYAKIADAIAQLKANGGGGGSGADIDLTAYATKVWVEAKGYITASTLTPYALKTDIPSLVGYATEDFVNNQLGDYATKDYVNNKLTNYATTDSVTAMQNTLTGQIGAVDARVDSNDEQIAILNETTSGHTTSIGTLTQRVDSVEHLASTKLDSSYFTLTNIKSTLGISDWALAATKPSYAWSEILSRPTALSQLTDDVVAGNYLPLSGGMVNGSITATSFIGELTGNADSATKLQTPRKLWGNDFDGTADVSGDITANKFIGYLRGDILYDNGVDEGHFIGLGSNVVGVKGLLNYVYGNFPILFYTNGFERMRIGDYVGIGTTSPTERLDVSGNIKASGNINATSITINGVTITASNGSITVNGNVLATGAITAKAVG